MSITLLLSAAMHMGGGGGMAPPPPAAIGLGQSRIQVGTVQRGRGAGFDRRRRPAPPSGLAVGESPISLGSWQRRGRGAHLDGRPFDPDRDRWRHRRHPRHDGHGDDFLFPWGAGGIAGPFEAVDPHGTGFFAAGGGRVRVAGGRPHYDYNRAYPYEWASKAVGSRVWIAEDEVAEPLAAACEVESGVRVCRGGR